MTWHAFLAWSIYVLFLPFLAVVMILTHYGLSRMRLRARSRPGRRASRVSGYCVAAGLAFLTLMQMFYKPDVSYLLEAKLDQEQDEDDSGDPESPEAKRRHFLRQLRRIRMGERVERLVWRM